MNIPLTNTNDVLLSPANKQIQMYTITLVEGIIQEKKYSSCESWYFQTYSNIIDLPLVDWGQVCPTGCCCRHGSGMDQDRWEWWGHRNPAPGCSPAVRTSSGSCGPRSPDALSYLKLAVVDEDGCCPHDWRGSVLLQRPRGTHELWDRRSTWWWWCVRVWWVRKESLA